MQIMKVSVIAVVAAVDSIALLSRNNVVRSFKSH